MRKAAIKKFLSVGIIFCGGGLYLVIWSASSSARCLSQYLALGWMSHVPKACDGGAIMVPITQSGFVWGWPNRFLERMQTHRTEVMLFGRIDGLWGANF
jgi:hypothetical protein